MEERILKRNSLEYKKLDAVCSLLNIFSCGEYTYYVDDCYLDFGADWMWTTIIAYKDESVLGSYQILSPRQWGKICDGEIEDITDIVNELLTYDKEKAIK